jgi:hypothetical protein
MSQPGAIRLQKFDCPIGRLSTMGALVICMFGGFATTALAQKDSRGWDGTSSQSYNNPAASGSSSYGSSSFGSYGGPSQGAFTPFGRVSPNSSTNNSSSNTSNSGNYYNSVPGLTENSYHPGSNAGNNTPFGNPNPKFTPSPNLSWQDQQIRNKQREQQLMQQQAAQPVNSSILQSQRWENEWRQQHPGQPMPNAGQLQKMHSAEIQGNIKNGWAQMRQRQAVKANEEYQMATEISKRNAARDGVTWSKAQFERDYDQSHKDQADAYLESVRQSREISDTEAEDRRFRAIGGR